MVDEFSKFSAGVILSKKSASADAFLKSWVSVFGAPNKIFSDNGGEFIGDDLYEICELFNISVTTTPANAPWSNGVCERHNQILTNIMLKVKEDVKGCNWHTALAWALSAKNSLLNCHGFSPAQLVFGKNVNLPAALNNKLPALEDLNDYSSVVALHLFAMNSARQAYISSESSSKIKLALRKQTRPTGKVFCPGDKVFYKRDESAKWKGPAVVLGQDNCVVFVRHGARYLKVHTCRLQHALPCKDTTPTDQEKEDHPSNALFNSEPSPPLECSSESEDENDAPPAPPIEETPSQPVKERLVLKKNDSISFLKNDVLCKAKVLGSAGKKRGPLKDWYNIEYQSPDDLMGKQISIDTNAIEIQSLNDQESTVVTSTASLPDHVVFNEPSEVLMIINQD